MKNKEVKSLINPDEIFSLKNKVIVIMGGAGKMGQAFSLVLSNAGAKVYIVDISEENAIDIANSLSKQTNSKITGIGCDLTNQAEIKKCFSRIVEDESRLDVLIYNVYSKPQGYYKNFEDYSAETWGNVMSANVNGAFLCSQEAIKIFKDKDVSGNIILTLSTYALVSPDLRIYEGLDPNLNIYSSEDSLTSPMVYTVSKSGLLGMIKWLAGTYGKYNIRINGLTPGGVYDGQEEKFCKAYVNKVPLGRMATWNDYNGAILFLCSDASQYMTGANLIVDGGWTAW